MYYKSVSAIAGGGKTAVLLNTFSKGLARCSGSNWVFFPDPNWLCAPGANTLPLSSARYPASLVAYSRSDYDGWRWWTTWFPDEEIRPAPELGQEIDAFQSQLLALPEFKTLWAMERMCRLYAQPTNEPTEFNLYAETAHFHIWLRLITRERDYNLYTYFFAK